MKITESVILSETKNLMLSMRYKTLHSVQGDTSMTFARASSVSLFYATFRLQNLKWYRYKCKDKYHKSEPANKFSFIVQWNLPVNDGRMSETKD